MKHVVKLNEDNEPKPWTIKGVSPEARNALVAAAARQNQTQGEWLTRMIPKMIQAELQENRLPALVAPLTTVVQEPPSPAPSFDMSIGEIGAAFELAERMAVATDKPIPRTITRAIEKQLKARLGVPPSSRKAS